LGGKPVSGRKVTVQIVQLLDTKKVPGMGGFMISPKTDIREMMLKKLTGTKLGADCCICQSTEKIEMHHVRHIRKMNAKLTPMETSMAALNRKQIPVCQKCHKDIHRGRYDGQKLTDIIKGKTYPGE